MFTVSMETLDEGKINTTEAILEPTLPIIDPHHHLWDRVTLLQQLPLATHPFEAIIRQTPRYLLDELLADVGSGHNVIASVYVQCGAFYRADGPEALKPVGETEFVRGVAAMSASGIYGPFRACAGIVGYASSREVIDRPFGIGQTIVATAGIEVPQVIILPTHRGLDDVMHRLQAGGDLDLHHPPDLRVDIVKADAQTGDGLGGHTAILAGSCRQFHGNNASMSRWQ